MTEKSSPVRQALLDSFMEARAAMTDEQRAASRDHAFSVLDQAREDSGRMNRAFKVAPDAFGVEIRR